MKLLYCDKEPNFLPFDFINIDDINFSTNQEYIILQDKLANLDQVKSELEQQMYNDIQEYVDKNPTFTAQEIDTIFESGGFTMNLDQRQIYWRVLDHRKKTLII